jgi:adenylate cyclase
MAVWGAPYAIPNHALQACQTALDQMECLTRLNQELSAEFGCHLEIRIGLNTGVVTAGNMGSANRFQYTVMGDAVNVGARLEDANRLCGTRILIGEATWARVHDQVETRQLGWARIRGKTKPVQLYELLAHQGELTPAMNQIIRTYAEALSAYHERQWDKAAALTQAILVLKPDDGPARLLHNTALQCKSNPPPDNWDLVLNMGA